MCPALFYCANVIEVNINLLWAKLYLPGFFFLL